MEGLKVGEIVLACNRTGGKLQAAQESEPGLKALKLFAIADAR